MLTKKERVLSLLDASLQEMKLLKEMSKDILQPDDFISSTSGLIVFRACGMSLQYITESFVKIRKLCGREFFNLYKAIPWDSVFGMQNQAITTEKIPGSFPQNWMEYDENGIAYVMTDNEILKYNLNNLEETSVPIHWEQVDFGGFVTYTSFYSNGIFSVSGKTRTAQSVTVLIDAETGDVSLTDLSEYSGSVIKSYYRLN